ncbi:nuclear RNA export factor 1-like isoform X1 [Schistocerca cancellata]|uniref:nuclear RNA export factor 1-like isoform X1 n=1 Tax=Schistocerca cancellata TaxID=274614 RepID=UPI0021191FAA|nr:nuclear RNA export factor 1-like isoform X1 [Schistocerca cancellata]
MGKKKKRAKWVQKRVRPLLLPLVPCQATSAAVTSTSGGAESAAAPEKVIQEDLTDEVSEVDFTNEVTEVEDTNDEIDVLGKFAVRLLAAHPNILSNATPNIWHKITVKPAGGDKVAILDAINKQISPLELIPYFFCMEGGHITFLVNNCSAALAALFRQNLRVPFYPFKQRELVLQLHSKKVNLSAVLQKIISKRLNSEKTVLDLSNLNSIPEYQQVMYDPSKSSHLQQQLLKNAQVMAPNLISLCLAGNELSTLSHLTPVFADKTKWRSLKVLDLMDNEIQTAGVLPTLNSLPITELYLHKNPVCGKYKTREAYTSIVTVNFPRLIKLDGTYVPHMPGLPQWRPNYIFCSSHGDSSELADQFIEHFFTLYDGEVRTGLQGLYHENAYFSLSSTYYAGQSTATSKGLSPYIAQSGNILHMSNKQNTKIALCHGAKNILSKLQALPQTQHDPYSFTVDVLHHSEIKTILTVTGVFKELTPKQDESPRHFMRTFVLVRLAKEEYQIVNDIVHVTNAATGEAENAFKYPKPDIVLKKIRPPREVTESDKNSMIEKFSQLTNMTAEWSHSCLDTADWDLRRALLLFIEMYEADTIPESGFRKPKEAAKS